MALETTDNGRILQEIIQVRGGTRPFIDSWNYAIRHGIPKVIQAFHLTLPNGSICKFTNPVYVRPGIPDFKTGTNRPILPSEARRTGQTYEAQLIATLQLFTRTASGYTPVESEKQDVLLGKIPVMIQSELDHNWNLTERERYMNGEPEKDPGGYFIIGGMEKYMNNPEHLRTSYPFMYEDKNGVVVRHTVITDVDSTVNIVTANDKIIVTTFTKIGISLHTVNIFYIFYCLGLTDNPVEQATQVMLSLIQGEKVDYRRRLLQEYLVPTIVAYNLQSQGNRSRIFQNLAEVFPPPKDPSNRDNEIIIAVRTEYLKNIHYKQSLPDREKRIALSAKIRTFAYMIVKYISYQTGFWSLDDRDSWANKKLDTPGVNFESKFLETWKKIFIQLQKDVTSKNWWSVNQIKNGLNTNIIAKDFRDAFNKGTWGRKDIPIGEALDRYNLTGTISRIRRITTPTNRKAKIRDKRLIHTSQWNSICPISTPEGEACGLVKDPAISIYISHERDGAPIYSRLNGLFTDQPDENHTSLIFLNGVNIGFCNGPSVYKHLIELRRSQTIYFDTGLVLNERGEIWISSTGGRIVIPYLIVDPDTQDLIIDLKGMRGLSIDDLMSNGAIEYVDNEEQVQSNILIAKTVQDLIQFRDEIQAVNQSIQTATNPKEKEEAEIAFNNIHKLMKYTHCIIDPSSILGIAPNTMPFIQHNPSARATYHGQMVKQALGADTSRVSFGFINTKIMATPNVPISSTDIHESLGGDKYPAGANAIVAILARGQNQEDAISFNKASIERGLFQMSNYHSYKVPITPSKSVTKRIGVPEHLPSQGPRYSKLNPETGIVRTGQYVYSDDCLIGITAIDNETKDKKNISVFVDVNREGVVEEVFESYNPEGVKVIEIRVRETRSPEIGDKFASRYAQKGVIGEFIAGEDVPFISSSNKALNGVVPDIIFNPHGIPGRMTIGKLIELMVSKVALMKGERINATAFRKFNFRDLKDALQQLGFNRSGKEKMINATTGRMMDVEVFVGSAYYQLLRHLVKYRMQARGTGPVHLLTRQPIHGFRKGGGLRYGEMETSQTIATGSQALVQERLMISSDVTRPIICRKCGLSAINDIYTGNFICRLCKNQVDPTRLEVPYPYILLQNYLAAVGIKLSAKTGEVV